MYSYERMFAFSQNRPELPASLAAKVRPVAAASSRKIPVDPSWEQILPEHGLRRGSTVCVEAAPGTGGLTLALSLLSGLSASEHWCAVVGVDDPGVVAMVDLGIDLRRVLFVPRPRGAWAECAADLLDGVDVLVVRPPSRPALASARRLMSRVRERSTVLIVLSEPNAQWPLPVDLTLEITKAQWNSSSRLTTRTATVRVSGRGSARRMMEYAIDLPSSTGRVLAS